MIIQFNTFTSFCWKQNIQSFLCTPYSRLSVSKAHCFKLNRLSSGLKVLALNSFFVVFISIPMQVLLFDPQHAILLQGGSGGPQKLPGKPLLISSGGSVSVGGSPVASPSHHRRTPVGRSLAEGFPQIRLRFDEHSDGGNAEEGEGTHASTSGKSEQNEKDARHAAVDKGRGRGKAILGGRKVQSTPSSPFGYASLSRYLDWSPKESTLSNMDDTARFSAARAQSMKEEVKRREYLGSGLDPNPFNPLF